MPITEEERVARAILLEEKPEIVLHMVDAKNLERMLAFTLQLIEAGFQTILVLNMMDEIEKLGKKIKVDRLQEQLRIPVVPVVSTTGRGMDVLKGTIEDYVRKSTEKNKV